MKLTNSADKVLFGVLVAFVTAWLIKISHQDNMMAKLAFSVMEAALVGGIADWFAVTALFGRPLGFAWHTALIPRNRDNLIRATALMVQDEFLSKQLLLDKIDKLPLQAYFIEWVEKGKGKYVLLLFFRKLIKSFLTKLDARSVAEKLETFLKEQAVNYKITPLIQNYASGIIAKNQHQQILDVLIASLLEQLEQASTKQAVIGFCVRNYQEEKNRDGFFKKIFKSAMEVLGQIDPEEFGNALYEQAVLFLKNVQADQAHPLRTWVKEKLLAVIDAIERDADTRKAIEDWKNNLIQEARFVDALEEAVKREKMSSDIIAAWLTTQLVRYWDVLKRNQFICSQLDAALKNMLVHLIDHEHGIIGEVVTKAMNKLTDKALNTLVEDRIGEELQMIRINGSLVGGLIGLILFCIRLLANSHSIGG